MNGRGNAVAGGLTVEVAALTAALAALEERAACPACQAAVKMVPFLLGVESLDGVWFGEEHHSNPGRFWWRDRLRFAHRDGCPNVEAPRD